MDCQTDARRRRHFGDAWHHRRSNALGQREGNSKLSRLPMGLFGLQIIPTPKIGGTQAEASSSLPIR